MKTIYTAENTTDGLKAEVIENTLRVCYSVRYYSDEHLMPTMHHCPTLEIAKGKADDFAGVAS